MNLDLENYVNYEDSPEFRKEEAKFWELWCLPAVSRPSDWWFGEKVKEFNTALGKERFSIEWKDGRIYGIGINRQDE